LNQESALAKELLAKLWQSTSESIPSDSLKYRYSLRGVATKPNITYVLRPCDDTKHDAMMDDDEAPEGMRWWRIEYDENGTKVSKTVSVICKTSSDLAVESHAYVRSLVIYPRRCHSGGGARVQGGSHRLRQRCSDSSPTE